MEEAPGRTSATCCSHWTSEVDLLARARLSRLAPVADADYDEVRRMLRVSGEVRLAV